VTGHHLRDDLPGLLLGELPPAGAAAVDRHLAGCDPCRRDLAAVAVASSALRDAARLPIVPAPDLPTLRPPAGRGREDNRAGRAAAGGARRPRPARWLLGAAAVLVALLLGVGGYSVGRDRGGQDAQVVALGGAPGGATAEARMRGDGDDQVMTMTARGLPRPAAGAYYEVWLVDGAGVGFPVGSLSPDGEGIWSLPTDVAARYRVIHVTLEPGDGDPAMSPHTVLRGAYA
jgi:anti-sigma factor RsiW